MKVRIDIQDLDMLTIYGPDSLLQQVVIVSEKFAVLEFENRFLHSIIAY
jgi:hypothetical protein